MGCTTSSEVHGPSKQRRLKKSKGKGKSKTPGPRSHNASVRTRSAMKGSRSNISHAEGSASGEGGRSGEAGRSVPAENSTEMNSTVPAAVTAMPTIRVQEPSPAVVNPAAAAGLNISTTSEQNGNMVSFSSYEYGRTFSLTSATYASGSAGNRSQPKFAKPTAPDPHTEDLLVVDQMSLCAPVVDNAHFRHHRGGCNYMTIYVPTAAERAHTFQLELQLLSSAFGGSSANPNSKVLRLRLDRVPLTYPVTVIQKSVVSGDGLLWHHPSLEKDLHLPLTAFRGTSEAGRKTNKFRKYSDDCKGKLTLAFAKMDNERFDEACELLAPLVKTCIQSKLAPKLLVLTACVVALLRDIHNLLAGPKAVLAALREYDLEQLLPQAMSQNTAKKKIAKAAGGGGRGTRRAAAPQANPLSLRALAAEDPASGSAGSSSSKSSTADVAGELFNLLRLRLDYAVYLLRVEIFYFQV